MCSVPFMIASISSRVTEPFFFAPFGHCKLKRVQVPVPTAAYAASHASRTGREAAGLRSLLPASVCQELVQSWRRASSSKLRLEG